MITVVYTFTRKSNASNATLNAAHNIGTLERTIHNLEHQPLKGIRADSVPSNGSTNDLERQSNPDEGRNMMRKRSQSDTCLLLLMRDGTCTATPHMTCTPKHEDNSYSSVEENGDGTTTDQVLMSRPTHTVATAGGALHNLLRFSYDLAVPLKSTFVAKLTGAIERMKEVSIYWIYERIPFEIIRPVLTK